MMKQVHVKVKFLVAFIGFTLVVLLVLWSIQESKKVTKNDKITISCAPADLRDTEFIKQIRNNDTILLPKRSVLETLSREELAFLYHRYIENIQYFCKRKFRLGSIEDGGWDVCGETAYQPVKPCLVYSFGINNDFTFDDAVIDKYGCEVHSFDPSMGQESYKRGQLNHFHALGIAGRNQRTKYGWELLTYRSILEQLGHTEKKISILKIDVERWEWDVLPNILKLGDFRYVDNFLIEFHLETHSPEQGWEVYFTAVAILKDLYDEGFRIFWTHQNKWCKFKSKCRDELRTNCHEVNFIKVKNT